MNNKILKEIVLYWKEHFAGIGSQQLSTLIGLSHTNTIDKLKELATEGRVNIREGYSGILIAFPSQDILEQIFKEEQADYGVFTNRLHKGDSQIRHCYFKHEVLDKYLKRPDLYKIHDDIVCGTIMARNIYYSVHKNGEDVGPFGQIRYGKRSLKDRSWAIAVILWDLSELSKKEQYYWASYEILNPEFAPIDKEFEKYLKQNLGGEWVSYEDPLRAICNTVRSINAILEKKLFKSDSDNPYLRYPVLNNEKRYQETHKELFKLIGTDSLDKNVLLEILREQVQIQENELLGENKELKGQWALFKVLITHIPNGSFEPFQECQDARTADAHKVAEAALPKEDLTKTFHRDCLYMLEELKRLQCFIEKKEV